MAKSGWWAILERIVQRRYSKIEQSDIASAEIRRIISECETYDFTVDDKVPHPEDS